MHWQHITGGLAGLLLCLWAGDLPAAAGPKVLTIEADLWCPINCDPVAPQPGIGIELAKKIFEPQGFTVTYTLVPWTQALQDARAGKVDAVVGANRYDDPKLIFPGSPIYNITDDFYVAKGSAWRFQGPHTLKGKRLGIVADYGYGDVVRQFIDEHKNVARALVIAQGKEPLKDNINKLVAGKIDVVVESKPVMVYTLKQMALEDKVQWAGSVPQNPVFLAFSPARASSKELARIFDEGMARLKKSGELDKLYKTYGLER